MLKYCPRCTILFEIARNPDKPWGIVLPPHDPRCPVIAHLRPLPLVPPAPLVPLPWRRDGISWVVRANARV